MAKCNSDCKGYVQSRWSNFSTRFTEAKEINLASRVFLFLRCLCHNYSEGEIDEKIELAILAYRAEDKGNKT